MSNDGTFQRRLRRAFLRFGAATTLLYGSLAFLVSLGTEEFLLRRYLGAMVERAIAQIEHPGADGAASNMLERVRALAAAPHRSAPGFEVVRFYVRGSPDLPAWAPSYGPGTHRRFEDGAMLRVAPIMGGSDTLYAVVDGDGVLDIDDFEPYVLLALLLIGAAVTVLSAAVGAVLARQLALPLVTLTREVNAHGEGPVEFSGAQRSDEVGALSRGFTALVGRLSDFLQREREFTRFASHELRTPVAVFKSSLAVLRATGETSVRERALARMAQSANDMEALVAALLALGRSPEEADHREIEETNVATAIDDLLERLAPLARQKSLRIALQVDPHTRMSAAPGLGPVLIDNLLRNAVAYADTWIQVRADARLLEIENDVREQPRSSTSTGYGLQIVSRICKRQGWEFVCGRKDDRYAARITFPAASGPADTD
ncbi:sensor histidine kinase [Variovorax paradoxus]|uniref:histidine kinase n=1 Tax=Variovorax paradoxus TaxID=34073 RepID=A0A6I6HM97_VARPD|nr:HAMP domain-containing sensor histidine kinase [Variovorax paradoxus]QGW83734.1 HAMP domain-containing protein [Variovorax paradoxus]